MKSPNRHNRDHSARKVALLICTLLLMPLLFTVLLTKLSALCLTPSDVLPLEEGIYYHLLFYLLSGLSVFVYYLIAKFYSRRYKDMVTEHIVQGFFLLYSIFVVTGVVFVIVTV